jgi:hypothetical protein
MNNMMHLHNSSTHSHPKVRFVWNCRHWVSFQSFLILQCWRWNGKNKTIKKCTVYNRHSISNINSDYQQEICVINDPIKKTFPLSLFFRVHARFTTFFAFDYQTIATLSDIKVNCNSSICPVIIVAHCYYSFFIFM